MGKTPSDALTIEETLLTLLDKPAKSESLSEELGLEECVLGEMLTSLITRGKVIEVAGGRYTLPKGDVATGYISRSRKGGSVFIPDEADLPIMEVHSSSNLTLEGDYVLVSYQKKQRGHSKRRDALKSRHKRKQKLQASVISVLRKRPEEVSGVYDVSPYGDHTVKLTGRDKPFQVQFTPPDEPQLRIGQIVRVRLQRQRGPAANWGEFVGVVSDLTDPNQDAESIAALFEFPIEFSRETEAELAQYPDDPSEEDFEGRLDLRERFTVVIDPADAKDHDDAFSVEELDDGAWRLGVHIADVSAYVKPGTAVDADAFFRGTSVYLPGKTIPMMPQKLSAGLCSLKQGVDRLAKSCFITYSATGKILRKEVYSSVIRVDAFIDYDAAQEMLDGKEVHSKDVDDAVRRASKLATVLRGNRMEAGSVVLSIDRPHLVVNKVGEITKIETDVQNASHWLIEEFMLAANCVVAEFLHDRALPYIGRIHPTPELEAQTEFEEFCQELGVAAPDFEDSRRVQLFLDGLAGRPGEHALHLAVLKTMQRAIYHQKPGLHYALGFHTYTHFTSPIRRLCDLRVHQTLNAYFDAGGKLKDEVKQLEYPWMDGAPPPKNNLDASHSKTFGTMRYEMANVARRATETEQKAQKAEIQVTQLKLLRLMEDRLGEEHKGSVTHISGSGLSVQIDEIWVEGIIPFNYLSDDWVTSRKFWIEYDSREGTKRVFVGDRVNVKVAKVDVATRTLVFSLMDDGSGELADGEFVDYRKSRKSSSGKGKSSGHSSNNAKGKKPRKGFRAEKSKGSKGKGKGGHKGKRKHKRR